ncbi:hypothetical protein CTEN210_18201 [Chaetoceros tenuissimus]|uniref:Transmembrane protein n=1 Tax=Chaetoceros tenuissimus TaxID=426638 RepID=A0AAD3DE45_9STRA|nr:hypothetical protein CTEN210_18201 [Chaetoceros tenuissimus]
MKYLSILFLMPILSEAFVSPTSFTSSTSSSSFTILSAKKKKSKNAGKGFGKETPTPQKQVFTEELTAGLSSIEQVSEESFSTPKLDLTIDPSLSKEERNREILKQQFGLRTYEEQQNDVELAKTNAKKKEAFQKQRAQLDKIKNMSDDEFDIFQFLPPSLLKSIDLFLKIGLGISTVAFILSGVGITAEAWTVATGNTLPENVDQFIVNVIEPNFTYGLLVLLGFSVSLGVFATAQLGSGSSVYKE